MLFGRAEVEVGYLGGLEGVRQSSLSGDPVRFKGPHWLFAVQGQERAFSLRLFPLGAEDGSSGGLSILIVCVIFIHNIIAPNQNQKVTLTMLLKCLFFMTVSSLKYLRNCSNLSVSWDILVSPVCPASKNTITLSKYSDMVVTRLGGSLTFKDYRIFSTTISRL